MRERLGLFRVTNRQRSPQINSYPNGLHFSITDAEAVDNHLSKRRNKTIIWSLILLVHMISRRPMTVKLVSLVRKLAENNSKIDRPSFVACVNDEVIFKRLPRSLGTTKVEDQLLFRGRSTKTGVFH